MSGFNLIDDRDLTTDDLLLKLSENGKVKLENYYWKTEHGGESTILSLSGARPTKWAEVPQPTTRL
jgi:hypothetical protein